MNDLENLLELTEAVERLKIENEQLRADMHTMEKTIERLYRQEPLTPNEQDMVIRELKQENIQLRMRIANFEAEMQEPNPPER